VRHLPARQDLRRRRSAERLFCGVGTCVPATCAEHGFDCDPVPDGCGGILDCRLTCAGQGYDCGLAGDGCGGVIDCGTCPPGKTCGGGGKVDACG
jgi:hypothetical protein